MRGKYIDYADIDLLIAYARSRRRALSAGGTRDTMQSRFLKGNRACRWHRCCQLGGAETSVRRRFLGSSRTGQSLRMGIWCWRR
jgi:hypothetical protein